MRKLKLFESNTTRKLKLGETKMITGAGAPGRDGSPGIIDGYFEMWEDMLDEMGLRDKPRDDAKDADGAGRPHDDGTRTA